ncbi:aromatic-ring-hydroxylating dioxygenase subunit beta [Rhodococcus sp. NPDC055024]
MSTTEHIEATVSVGAEDLLLRHEIEQFLFNEAHLLDTWQWRPWLNLFTEDTRYWIPLRRNRLRNQRPAEEADLGTYMAHFDESWDRLDKRVRQLESSRHWAEDPPSRTRHVVSNVRVTERNVSEDELTVRSSFILYRNRLESEVDVWAGGRKDVLRRTPDGWRIAARTVLLDQNVILSKNLSVFF